MNFRDDAFGRLHRFLKTDIRRMESGFLPRPFIVEIAGSPSSGKTTLIKEMTEAFKDGGLRVYRPQEGAEMIRYISNKTPLYNYRTALYSLSLLIDVANGNQYDLVVFDRCIFDTFIWMDYWHNEEGLLSKEERDIAHAFFLNPRWTSLIDLAYFVVCDGQTAANREMQHGVRKGSKSGWTDPEKVQTFVKIYSDAHLHLSPSYPNLKLLDTTNLSLAQATETMTDQLMKVFLEKISARTR